MATFSRDKLEEYLHQKFPDMKASVSAEYLGISESAGGHLLAHAFLHRHKSGFVLKAADVAYPM